MSGLWLGQLKVITYTRSTSFSESFHRYNKEGEIPTRKEKYPANKCDTSAIYQAHYNFLHHSFTCFALQIFARNLPKWSKLKYSRPWHCKYLKKYERVSLIPFIGNPFFSILEHRVRYLKNLFLSQRQQIIIFRGESTIRDYGRASINSRSLLLAEGKKFSENKNLTSNIEVEHNSIFFTIF